MSKGLKVVLGVGGVIAALSIWGGTQSGGTSSPSPSDPVGAVENSLGLSSSQSNAKRQAENYLSTQAFSRKDLIGQLKYEGYSTADATYAVDNVTVDWYDQAAKKAKEYLDTQPFSRSDLVAQLEYEGFSSAQAQYGVSQAY